MFPSSLRRSMYCCVREAALDVVEQAFLGAHIEVVEVALVAEARECLLLRGFVCVRELDDDRLTFGEATLDVVHDGRELLRGRHRL